MSKKEKETKAPAPEQTQAETAQAEQALESVPGDTAILKELARSLATREK